MGAGVFLGGLNKGRTQHGSVPNQAESSGVCVGALDKGMAPSGPRLGSAQGPSFGHRRISWGLKVVAHKMDQCQAQEVAASLLLGVMNMGSTWPPSVQDATFGLRVVCKCLHMGRS